MRADAQADVERDYPAMRPAVAHLCGSGLEAVE
jgi:hypothetical protein